MRNPVFVCKSKTNPYKKKQKYLDGQNSLYNMSINNDYIPPNLQGFQNLEDFY